MSRTRRRLAILATVVVLLFAGTYLRGQLGLELSPESLRAWVSDLGWYGPLIFVMLVALRAFVILPSMLILTAGGLVFGVAVGTLLGTVGVLLSGALSFAIARGIVRRRASGGGEPSRRALQTSRANAVGSVGVAAVTAHPLGPMTPTHIAAGLSSMSLDRYFAALAVGAPVRAFGYSYFGTSIADVGSNQFYIATALLLVMIVVPLLHTGTRRRIFAAAGNEGIDGGNQ